MIKKILNLIQNGVGKSLSESPGPEAQALIDEIHAERGSDNWNSFKLNEFERGREVIQASPEEQKKVALGLIPWLTRKEIESQKKRRTEPYSPSDGRVYTVKNSLEELLRKKLPFSEEELLRILEWSMTYQHNGWRSIPVVIKQVQDFQKRDGRTPRLTAKINEYIDCVSRNQYSDAENRQQIHQLSELAGRLARNPLVSGEAWSDDALSRVNGFDESTRANWIELLNVCVAAKGSVPTGKWRKASDAALENVGWDNFKTAVLSWFPLVDKPRTNRIWTWSEWSPDPNLLINDHNADVLKGLVWMSTSHADADVLRAVAALAISAYRKVPQVGPRCVRVGNACVWALGEMNDAVGHLAVLKVRIKFGTAQKLIETALEKAANRAGVPKEEIEEMSVPDYGLQKVGYLTEKIGNYSAEIAIRGTDDVIVRWFNSEGRQLKSTPASLKKDFADDIKELNQTLKDIRQMLPAQRNRIDCLYLEQKKWNHDVWRERYLDHPLVGTIARRLIWKFADADGQFSSGIWLDGIIVSAKGDELDLEDTTVELWHPLDEASQDVLRWREFLEQNVVRQPFKQAHREIYLLTDAERNTRVYSNRYAAHILKQHQFNALCAARQWKNRLRLLVDDEYPPASRSLFKWNLRAEFWIEGIGDDYGTDTNDSGTFLYLTTDQVRFYSIDSRENSAHAGGGGYGTNVRGAGHVAEPLDLEHIPPLVFSEIMRDVDLFVGVASVGNDPNWLDTGPDGARTNYWHEYSFGDLSVSAKARKEILENIIPRLKIAPRCKFDDKFLIVEGDVRTYKIHLGSGNILMKPNDQYLCIVAKQGTTDTNKVFLPFEGDQRVAVILSKAFLLADDKKINDTTILRQIRTT